MRPIFLIALIFTCNILWSQSDTEKAQNKLEAQTYLKKAKKQGSAGAALVIVGASFVSIGTLMAISEISEGFMFDSSPSSDNSTAISVFIVSGITLMAGSIPFFVMSGNNRRTARMLMDMSAIEVAPGVIMDKQLKMGIGIRINYISKGR